MASESTTSIPLVENSDSSDWSSTEEKEKPKPIEKQIQLKLFKEKKSELTGKPKTIKKKKRLVTVCLTHCRYEVIKRVAQNYGYKEVSESEHWNMYWTDLSITVDRCKDMKRFQKINHFPGRLQALWLLNKLI